jgi:Tol biopolymer transport system component
MKNILRCILLVPFLLGCVQVSQTETQPSQASKVAETIAPLPMQTLMPTTTQPEPVSWKDLIISTAQASNPPCDTQSYAYFDTVYDYSPNERWLVLNCEGPKPVAFVVDLNQSRFWTISSYEYISGNNNDIKMHGRRWTQDGNYVYLEPHFCCADGPSFYNGWGLIKLDLRTGEYKTILQPSFSDTAYSFSISPDDRFLVYVSSRQNQLVHILDLENDNEQTIKFKVRYTDIGDFVWTPDGSEILMVAGLEGWRDQKGGFSIFLYNTKQDSVRVLVNDDKRQLDPPVSDYEYDRKSLWLTDETIILNSLDGQFVLNIHNGEMTPFDQLTPTQ